MTEAPVASQSRRVRAQVDRKPREDREDLAQKPTPEEIEAASQRIEAENGRRVGWAVRFAQKDLRNMTAGDWYNLRLDLAAFILPFQGTKEDVTLLSRHEVRQLHQRFRAVLSELIRVGRVKIGGYRSIELVREQTGATTMLVKASSSASPTQPYILYLSILLFERQHLVKACPAPALRDTRGESCGQWFLARRPNQVYCSRRCQTRESTRAFRQARAKKRQSIPRASKGGR